MMVMLSAPLRNVRLMVSIASFHIDFEDECSGRPNQSDSGSEP